MFCEGCGHEIQSGITYCPTCGAAQDPNSPLRYPSQQNVSPVAEQARLASQDTLQALKAFAVNPTGAMLPAYEMLDPSRAYGVGVMLALIFDGCLLFAINRMSNNLPWQYSSVGNLIHLIYHPEWLKLFLVGLSPVISLTLAIVALRLIFQGRGRADGDLLVAGLALLPLGFTIALGSILGVVNVEVTCIFAFFAVCYMILILFTGCLRIARIPEARAAFAVPLVLLLSAWLLKVVVTTLW